MSEAGEPGEAPEPRSFYTETLPEQWNRALREQERRVEAEQRVLEGMRAVDATLRVRVEAETFYLNIAKGRLETGESAAHPPVLTLVQERRDFQRLMQDAGESPLGFLGVLSGLAGEMKLTASRLEGLRRLSGSLRFEVTGDAGFALLAGFGEESADPADGEPNTRIRIAPEVYADLRSGALDPQNAFMSGRIEVEGDMQLAMQLALAVMAPE